MSDRRPVKPLLERLFAKVRVTPGGCWVWTASTCNGYGALGVGRRGEGVRQAHRLLYELMHGALPSGWQVDHLCRNRACVNPAHLEGVPQQVNLERQAAAMKAARTHCKRGHEFTPENTVIQKGRFRRCVTCQREGARRNAARRKQESAA